MNKRSSLVFPVAAAFAAGFLAGPRGPVPAKAQYAEELERPTRVSTAAVPRAWGTVRAALGRDEITLILEDEAGTIRAVTLDKSLTKEGGKPAVSPRLFTVVPRR